VKTRQRSYEHARNLANSFQRLVFAKELSTQFPNLTPSANRDRYGIHVLYLPQPLKPQVEQFLGWMEDPVGKFRDSDPMRPATVTIVREFLQRFVGFVCLVSIRDEEQGDNESARQGVREARNRLYTLLQGKNACRKEIPEIGNLVRVLLGDATSLERILTDPLLTRSSPDNKPQIVGEASIRQELGKARGAICSHVICDIVLDNRLL
jgi:hypothetical protein